MPLKITYKIIHKMEALQLNPTEYPHLSQWESNHLNQTLENLSRQANPSKMEITQADKQWAATMLEMDLAAQSGAIWEDEKEDPKWAAIEEHNRKYYHLKTLFQEGKAEELEQIFLTETNPDLKEVARHFFLELEDLPH